MKKESDEMDYDEGRCVVHGKDISYIKTSLEKIKKFLFDNNGEKGISMRLHDVENSMSQALKMFEEQEKRKQRKYDRLTLLLFAQAIGFILALLLQHLTK